jgi:hypothetical protein
LGCDPNPNPTLALTSNPHPLTLKRVKFAQTTLTQLDFCHHNLVCSSTVTHGLGKNYFDQCRGWVNKKITVRVFRFSSVPTPGINNERSLTENFVQPIDSGHFL